MSGELYEVAFSGQVSEGADVDKVKAKVGKMFNADEAKLAQLFSGKRIVIKKNIDEATATKYKTALNRSGAECEIKVTGAAVVAGAPAAAEPTPTTAPTPDKATAPVSTEYESIGGGEVVPPPQTDPLGISVDQIDELSVTMAPVGSELQDAIKQVEEPQIDITGFDIAPVGSELSTANKEPDPPPPDTNGITMAD